MLNRRTVQRVQLLNELRKARGRRLERLDVLVILPHRRRGTVLDEAEHDLQVEPNLRRMQLR